MAIFKCKMCGGTLEINSNQTVATCEYCGRQQTLPRLDDEKRANLYDRANHFRRNNEYDKAMGIYEQILNEDKTDAEAYWSLVLCRYGIEYVVEDELKNTRVPTVHRAQFTSIYDDDNYKSALQYADALQRSVYEAEAKTINEIQKGILAISQQEEPFDIFICYKELDANKNRTPDSVLAQELYYKLTNEGFKVFFARITLEDILGTAYEPYIFAALNSSKVMITLGTRPEYFKAVWVKNEWSRYLSLIKQGQKKFLIPAYKDMDPYDLPDEFSHLQAQDMSKLGWDQDLIRGIKKLIKVDEPKVVVKETVVAGGTTSNVAPLLERAMMFLEDGDWNSANEYCERVLDIDPKNAMAYVGKLMSELQVKKLDNLRNCANPFDQNANYQKAVRFADDKLKNELSGYVQEIITRNENKRLEIIYVSAKREMKSATEDSYKKAAKLFESIKGYKDADDKAKECLDLAGMARKEKMFQEALFLMKTEKWSNLEKAAQTFAAIPGYKDADARRETCLKKAEYWRERDKEEKARKAEEYKEKTYLEGKSLMTSNQASNLQRAVHCFTELYGYKDSDELLVVANERLAKANEKLAIAEKKAEQRKKNKKTISKIIKVAIVVLVIAGIVGIVLGVSNSYKKSNGLNYKVDKATQTCTITGVKLINVALQKDIVVPAEIDGYKVTAIGEKAFQYCDAVTSITLPDTITEIGEGAFSGCKDLENVNIPEGVKEIKANTFYNCTNLKDITIPYGVESIGERAFDGCWDLTTLSIPSTVKSIGEKVCYQCSELTSVIFEDPTGWEDSYGWSVDEKLSSPSKAASELKYNTELTKKQ